MKWLRKLLGRPDEETIPGLEAVQQKFAHFLGLLDLNNRVLADLADLEEKAQGEYLFDINYVRNTLDRLRQAVGQIVDHLIALGGREWAALKDRLTEIDRGLRAILPGGRRVEPDAFTLPFAEVDQDRLWSVGSKNAHLGEMRGRLGLPVPDGFAITAWAYKHFIDSGRLQSRISQCLADLDLKSYADLVRASRAVQAMVAGTPVPDDLAATIRAAYAALVERSGTGRVALRSSALGEDMQLSFAGQYATFLNVAGDELIDRYREIIASKFSPKAIYYFLSHELSESELAMSVGCVEMIDAVASGVLYTRNPVRPDDGCVVVNAIFGLGPYLVDGTLTPDVFRVSREDGSVREATVAVKPVRLVMRPEGGVAEEPVPAGQRRQPALEPAALRQLAEYGLKVEAHYGTAQDIEWAMDRQGRLVLLQTRPLRVVAPKDTAPTPPTSSLVMFMPAGTTVCPGAGSGPVFHARSLEDLAAVPPGAVLVAPHPFPGLVTAMGKASAVVTETGGVASHMATIAREYRVPTVAGIAGASALPAGEIVTVDATAGAIYAGAHPQIVEARRPETGLFDDLAILNLLRQVVARVSPLRLVHPADPNFTPAHCRTLHDITRLAHQKAMEIMFTQAVGLRCKERIGRLLQTEIPLRVYVIYIDRDPRDPDNKGPVDQERIGSEPMQWFWEGVRQEGWPAPPQPDVKGLVSVMATEAAAGSRLEFCEESFAILSRQYMILSLGMGYHFTTVEALCTDEPSKNYIRMQYKEGGASLDRRLRRIRLIATLLGILGFENSSKGDFLDAGLAYPERRRMADLLRTLGRLTILTKQLDMALCNDSIVAWYVAELKRKLGLNGPGKGQP